MTDNYSLLSEETSTLVSKLNELWLSDQLTEDQRTAILNEIWGTTVALGSWALSVIETGQGERAAQHATLSLGLQIIAQKETVMAEAQNITAQMDRPN